MLKHLSIKNYAIIDEIDIDFDGQLNIITGETGAGKSIILGALNMILGKRAEISILRDKVSKAIIEGTFEVAHLNLEQLYKQHDLEYEAETIIRREIRPNGKSRAFVNDSPVNLDQLKALTSQLVEIHGQQDSASLLDRKFYSSTLDKLAGQSKLVSTFTTDFHTYHEKRNELETLKRRLQDQRSDLDYLEFQQAELEEVDLNAASDSAIEEDLALLENAGQIIEQLNATNHILEDGEINVLEMLREAQDKIGHLSHINTELSQLSARLEAVLIEVEDISASSQQIANRTDIDEEQLAHLRSRQNAINRLLQKHQLQDVEQLMQFHAELNDRLNGLKVSNEDLEALEAELKELGKALLKNAKKISKQRLGKSKDLEKEVVQILQLVGMPHARIELRHQTLSLENMRSTGIDDFELYFSANKGVEPESLRQVASGGERSRLMLALKSVVAKHLQLSTMIFDEIDTGISGEVAARVGDIFQKMSADHQLISITHLPQIAAHADHHLFVYKDDSQPITVARIKVLDQDDKILEIAKMLSGDDPKEAAMTTARELIG